MNRDLQKFDCQPAELINLENYCGGEKILSHPRFQHCGGERSRCSRGSDAFAIYSVRRKNVSPKVFCHFLSNHFEFLHEISHIDSNVQKSLGGHWSHTKIL